MDEEPAQTLIDACCAPLASPIGDPDAVALERLFRALGDRHRVKILSMLSGSDEPICVCDFVDPLGVSQPTVSYHLKQLGGAGLVERERRGTFIYYRLVPGALDRIRDVLAPSDDGRRDARHATPRQPART